MGGFSKMNWRLLKDEPITRQSLSLRQSKPIRQQVGSSDSSEDRHELRRIRLRFWARIKNVANACVRTIPEVYMQLQWAENTSYLYCIPRSSSPNARDSQLHLEQQLLWWWRLTSGSFFKSAGWCNLKNRYFCNWGISFLNAVSLGYLALLSTCEMPRISCVVIGLVSLIFFLFFLQCGK